MSPDPAQTPFQNLRAAPAPAPCFLSTLSTPSGTFHLDIAMPNLLTPTSPCALAPSIIGQAPPRLPVAGRIRAGIKVLSKAAAAIPQAQSIYDQGVQDGRSFDFIEDALARALPDLRNPLVPKNMPWFTVRGGDFSHPDLARQILQLHGEDRGDGEVRLYRFPVVFPSDSWQAVMPHELVAWGASERKFWSEYSADGTQRYCKCHAPVPKDPRDKTGVRAIRVFGGRKAVLREDNGGLCEPESCAQYQSRQCNLTGRFVFFIPGIRSLAAFELPTNSFYAMKMALQTFRTIAFMRGGRISGFLDGSKTPFYLSKRLMEVPHIDAEGRAVRVKQWIIELEAPIDVTALLRPQEDELIGLAASARQVLEGHSIIDAEAPSQPTHASSGVHDDGSGHTWNLGANAAHADDAGRVDPGSAPERGRAAQAQHRASQELAGVADAPGAGDRHERPATHVQRPARPGRPDATAGETATRSPGSAAAEPSAQAVLDAAQASGVSQADYEAYAAKRWGSGWRLNAAGRRRALQEIEALREEPQALVDKVRAELDVFS